MGFGNEKPGSATDLLRCEQSSAARFGRCSEGQVPSRTGIPIPISISISISISTLVQTMI
jgi:hypothetical protein